MNNFYDRALLVIVAAAIAAAFIFLRSNDKSPEISEPVTPIIYRPTIDTSLTPADIECNQALYDDALRVIHKHYGQDTKITIPYVNAAKSFIEIRVNGIELGSDGSYAGLTTMYAALCKLDDKRIILSAIGGLDMLIDFPAIEVFRGNRKPINWDEEKERWGFAPDEPWKRNREAYGAGLTSDEDDEYERARVEAIVRERGLSPLKQGVQPSVADYRRQGAPQPEP